jgi:ATP-dependent HslUV protease subunit HslV
MAERIHSTTVLGIIHEGKAVLAADGQATMGSTVIKSNVKKVRLLADGNIMAGFAGSTSDAFALLERLEEKLNLHRGNLRRACIELAKDWRTDRYLRRLEAMLIVMNKEEGLMVTGTGDVLEPDNKILAIGSGSMYAQSAALALKKHAPQLSARQMVEESLHIAADICIYTNHNLEILEL